MNEKERQLEAARETIQRFETDDTLAAESFDGEVCRQNTYPICRKL